jgi:hypothetical protein
MRFKILGLALAAILAGALSSLQGPQAGAFEIFLWLSPMLVVSGVALWPTTGRDQRVELELERLSWADRIEFKEASSPEHGAQPPRGVPPTSRTVRAG